jgi:hypothetical protein
MAAAGAAGARRRRARWAQHRNAALQARYVDRLARWRQVAAHLERAEQAGRAMAAGRPATGPGGPPLELAPGESVLAELPALALVEVRRTPGRRRAGYAGYSPRGAAELRPRLLVLVAGPQRVRGQGAVTVTDRRIVFHGPEDHTEWPLDRLIRLEHARRRPVSLLHVAGRRGVFGLLYRTPDAAQLRAVLELAAAGTAPAGVPAAGSATDRRAAGQGAVLAHLAADRRRHALDRPRPPWPVSPDQAPGPTALVRRAFRTFRALPASQARHRLRWRFAQAALAVLATVAAVSMALPHRPAAPSAGPPAAAATSSPAAPPAAPAPTVPAAGRVPAPAGAPAPAAGTTWTPRPRPACRTPDQDRGPRACQLAASAPARPHAGTAGAHGRRDPFRVAHLRAAAVRATPLWVTEPPHKWATERRATHPWAWQSRGHGHRHCHRPTDGHRASHRVPN